VCQTFLPPNNDDNKKKHFLHFEKTFFCSRQCIETKWIQQENFENNQHWCWPIRAKLQNNRRFSRRSSRLLDLSDWFQGQWHMYTVWHTILIVWQGTYVCTLPTLSSRVARWFLFEPKIPNWVNFGGP
jgi:hypothetical protein